MGVHRAFTVIYELIYVIIRKCILNLWVRQQIFAAQSHAQCVRLDRPEPTIPIFSRFL